MVENNLNHLVEDIDLKEQQLFKLDSIFSVVGIEGESEVLKIIQVSFVTSQFCNSFSMVVYLILVKPTCKSIRRLQKGFYPKGYQSFC